MKKAEAFKLAKEVVRDWLAVDCHEKPNVAENMSGAMKLTQRIADLLENEVGMTSEEFDELHSAATKKFAFNASPTDRRSEK